MVAEITGAHVLYARRKSETDPNWNSDIPYKQKLSEISREHPITFVLDIHGASFDREFGIALGTINGESCPKEQMRIIEELEKFGFLETTKDELSRVDVNSMFSGTGLKGQETVIGFLRKLSIPSAQFEINAHLRIPERRLDASAKEAFKGDPNRITQTINALVSIIRMLSQS